jgi:hypothetical protein
VEGMIKVEYTVMCKNDVTKHVSLEEILANEKIIKAIKSEFATGLRNLVLSKKESGSISIQTQKEIFEFTVEKNDFADLLELAEEDAKKHKRIKKDCEGVELINITTID